MTGEFTFSCDFRSPSSSENNLKLLHFRCFVLLASYRVNAALIRASLSIYLFISSPRKLVMDSLSVVLFFFNQHGCQYVLQWYQAPASIFWWYDESVSFPIFHDSLPL